MNRSGKTDAVQIGGNDNHPEKMGNRQQQTNPADVAAFPKGCQWLFKSLSVSEWMNRLQSNSAEADIPFKFLRPTQTCCSTCDYLLPLAKCLHWKN